MGGVIAYPEHVFIPCQAGIACVSAEGRVRKGVIRPYPVEPEQSSLWTGVTMYAPPAMSLPSGNT